MTVEFAKLSEPKRMAHFIDGSELVGKTVKAITYTDDDCLEATGWGCRGAEIEFDDGTMLILLQDDEANGPGSGLVIHPNSGETYLPVF